MQISWIIFILNFKKIEYFAYFWRTIRDWGAKNTTKNCQKI